MGFLDQPRIKPLMAFAVYHSEPVKLSTAVARASIGVRGKARGAKTREFGEPNDRSFRVAQRRRSRKAASAAGWRYFHRLLADHDDALYPSALARIR